MQESMVYCFTTHSKGGDVRFEKAECRQRFPLGKAASRLSAGAAAHGPGGSLANVLYQIGLSRSAPDWVNLGNCTIAVYCLYILAEAVILGKDFKASMLLQLAASFLFGQLVNLAGVMLAFLPEPGSYLHRMAYLLCSVPLVAAGVMMYLSPSILPTPGEGMSLAISQKSGRPLPTSKTIFDCTMVTISALTSLLAFRKLVGVREGTVICALTVGLVMRQLQKPLQKPLLRFVGRERSAGQFRQSQDHRHHRPGIRRGGLRDRPSPGGKAGRHLLRPAAQ